MFRAFNPQRVLTAALLAALFLQTALSIAAGTLPPKEVRELFAAMKFEPLLDRLAETRAGDPGEFKAGLLPFVGGRAAQEAGDSGLANAYFIEAADSENVTSAYSLWNLSRSMRASGNLVAERLLLLDVLTDRLAGDHLRSFSEARLPESYLEGSDPEAALRIAESPKRVPGDPEPEAREPRDSGLEFPHVARQRLARALALEATGRKKDAVSELKLIVESLRGSDRSSDIALIAASTLERISERSPSVAGALPHLQMASIYQENRQFGKARAHWEAVAGEMDSSGSGNGGIEIGKGYAQEGDHLKAIEWFERVRSKATDAKTANEALYREAGSFSELREFDRALDRYQRFVSTNPGDEEIAKAYLNIIDIHRDQGDPDRAVALSERIGNEQRTKISAELAKFARVRILISQKNWHRAATDLSELSSAADLGRGIPGGSSPDEITFLEGYALEKAGRFDQALNRYLALEDGITDYYGHKANERIRYMSVNEAPAERVRTFYEKNRQSYLDAIRDGRPEEARKFALSALRLAANEEARSDIRAKLAKLNTDIGKNRPANRMAETAPRETKAVSELEALGLLDTAATILLEDKGNRSPLSYVSFPVSGDLTAKQEAMLTGSWLAFLGIEHSDARLREARSGLSPELGDREDLAILYPIAYRGLILEYSKEFDLDPRFVLSIIRQESRFRPDAKSYAAARGVMQMIPETAEKTAENLELKGFDVLQLYDPDVSIRMGCSHLKSLFSEFADEPEAVAAAYNAGADNMKRWMARAGSKVPEEYVPEIRYAQTKEYVEKVMANYRVYRSLYDERLEPITK